MAGVVKPVLVESNDEARVEITSSGTYRAVRDSEVRELLDGLGGDAPGEAVPELRVSSLSHQESLYRSGHDSGPPSEQSPASWDACADSYDCFARSVTAPFAEDALKLVRVTDSSRVLDVAAGTGAFALAAAQRGARVVATDFSHGMLRTLRLESIRRELLVDTAQMDGQALELEDETFDVAASLFGLMFFPSHERGMRELARVLRPGGQAVVGVWAPPARVEMMRLVGEATMAAMVEAPLSTATPDWLELTSAARLKTKLKECGFSRAHVVTVRHVWAFDSARELSALLPTMTPSSMALFSTMNGAQRRDFADALVNDLRSRQGDGPYAVTSEALLAVATK